MPYADVNGLHMYYEERGAGPPLVLLHGGVTTIELSFGAVIPVLAEHDRVIAVELQGHGRTPDTDRPMTFEHLAGDVVGLLDHLGIDQADVFGFSLGGLSAHELLVRHPWSRTYSTGRAAVTISTPPRGRCPPSSRSGADHRVGTRGPLALRALVHVGVGAPHLQLVATCRVDLAALTLCNYSAK
jgi:pimeloyl-ACP methyl ester carboxylesterase